MENKEFPELESREIIPEEIPVQTDTTSEVTPEATDYFTDILPEQPADTVTDEASEAEEAAEQPAEAVIGRTADTQLLSEIQAAVQDIIAQESAPEAAPEETLEEPSEETSEEVPAVVQTEASVSIEELLPEEPAEDPLKESFSENEGFEEIFNAKAPDSGEASHDRPVRKGRPKRRKGEFLFGIPQIAVTCVWLAIILVTGLTLGRMLWVCAADVLAFGRENKMVTITVYESDTMDDIIEKLHENQLIRYPGLFKLYADLAVDEGEIKPGIWDLNTMYDYHALVNMMSPSSSRTVVENVLIPEGFTCRQIFQLLEENRVCTAKDLAEYAASGELKEYWFLENVDRGYEYCLEGFLFPDTYDFYKNSSPRDVLEKLLDNFDYRFTEEMRAQMGTLNANVTQGTFDIHKVVIVASMIEKETASNAESPKIASVIYNRLFNWGGTPAFLNIDASIVYALDGKTDLTAEDLKIESPYNTYTNTGLTPGAISNPGLASLKAALNPETTNYYFYVLNPAEGRHKFSTTLNEHNAFIASLE